MLPPGELNGIIPEPLPIYTESFMAISVNVFLSMLRVNKDTRATKKTLLYNTVIINYYKLLIVNLPYIVITDSKLTPTV